MMSSSLTFDHQTKSNTSSNINRMWLTTCASSPEDGSTQNDDPGSPPLEGGEALCELLLDTHPSLEKTHLHLLTNLPSYLEDHNVECLHDVFPAIQEALPMAQPEVQLAASNSFLTILEKELIPHATFTQTFLQSILASVDSKDPIVANAWVETLLDVIDLLPKDVIRQEILSLAVAKGQISQPLTSRLSCCRMLGKICGKFEPYLIKKEILPVVQSLCQDVDYEVRGCMCRQLDAVARGLGLEATKSAILPELVELANDEESYVQLAGIETVVNMLSLLDDETCTQIIVPLVKKFCENAMKSEDITLPVVAKQLGKLCHGLSVNLTFDQKLWFLEFYREVARLGLPHHKDDDSSRGGRGQPPMPDIVPRLDYHDKDRAAECRYCCAYNFPAMVLFAGPSAFKEQLYETFHDLACDPYIMVRRTIASGLHEVAKLLGPCVYFIQEELISLLRDDSLEVLKGLIAHLPITLEAIAKEGTMGNELKLTGGEEVMTAVMRCEEEISKTSNWRLHAQFLDKLSCLPKCLPSNLIFHKFVPLFFQKLFTVRPIPCRMAVASTLLVYLRSNPRQDQRQELCQRLIEELCNGRSCHTRLLFIAVCDLVMDIFSKTFFKDNFFLPLLGLAEDCVANVRLRLCRIIPRLKTLLKFPMDSGLLQELEICVGKLMIDEEDRDVSAAVRVAIAELDKIEIPVETTSWRSTNLNSGFGSTGHLDDNDDQQTEHEERYVADLEGKTSSPVLVPRSPEKKPLRPAGKIPVRRSIGGKGSPELKRCSLVLTSLSTSHLRPPSPTLPTSVSPTMNHSGKTASAITNGSVTGNANQTSSSSSPSSVSRIPTLAKSPNDRTRPVAKTQSTTTARNYTSPPRPTPPITKPAIPPRNSIGSPVPSPECVRRVMQNRSYTASTVSTRRKSVGPGTIMSSTLPRSTAGARLSGLSKQTTHSPSHIPRYPSSSVSFSLPLSASSSSLSPTLPDDDLLDSFFLQHDGSLPVPKGSTSPFHFLSFAPTNIPPSPPAPPDDYELELMNVGAEEDDDEDCHGKRRGLTCASSPCRDLMLALSQGGRSSFPSRHSLLTKGLAQFAGGHGRGSAGGGGKMFAHWSRSHLPRCTTPPVVNRSNDSGAQRFCRSASSSPTNTPRSFIPRYVGGCGFRSPTPPTTPLSLAAISRTRSASQLAPSTPVRRGSSPATPPGATTGKAHTQVWGRRGARASSLPGTPRSVSPTHTFAGNSRIPRSSAAGGAGNPCRILTPSTLHVSSRAKNTSAAKTAKLNRVEDPRTDNFAPEPRQPSSVRSVWSLVHHLESLAASSPTANATLSSTWTAHSTRRFATQDHLPSPDNNL